MADLKTTFIQRSLTKYMEQVMEGMRRAAQRMGIGVTNDAIRSLAFRAIEDGAGGAASLSFKEYLRFVDMGVGRGHPLGGLKSMRVTLQSRRQTGEVLRRDNTRKAKKLYSRVAYGNLTWLMNQLLYGYTEEAIANLKTELANADRSSDA